MRAAKSHLCDDAIVSLFEFSKCIGRLDLNKKLAGHRSDLVVVHRSSFELNCQKDKRKQKREELRSHKSK